MWHQPHWNRLLRGLHLDIKVGPLECFIFSALAIGALVAMLGGSINLIVTMACVFGLVAADVSVQKPQECRAPQGIARWPSLREGIPFARQHWLAGVTRTALAALSVATFAWATGSPPVWITVQSLCVGAVTAYLFFLASSFERKAPPSTPARKALAVLAATAVIFVLYLCVWTVCSLLITFVGGFGLLVGFFLVSGLVAFVVCTGASLRGLLAIARQVRAKIARHSTAEG
jgi:hypothetical protein